MRVLVSGGSGFLGSALIPALKDAGHEVTQLVRREAKSAQESRWDPASGRIDQVEVDRCDAVINLSGATIVHWPRTAKYKKVLRDSRLDCTRTLANAITSSSGSPVFLSGSASGFYGQDRGSTILTEHSSSGDGFLAELCRDWEAAANAVSSSGSRVVNLRTSLIVGSGGGLMGALKPLFNLGGGARLGSGRQYMPLMTRNDWVRAVIFALENDSIQGPLNLVAPAQVTNAEFTDELGSQLNRPTFMVAPAPVLKVALGSISGDLLGSLRMTPKVLVDAGFDFDEPDLSSMIAASI